MHIKDKCVPPFSTNCVQGISQVIEFDFLACCVARFSRVILLGHFYRIFGKDALSFEFESDTDTDKIVQYEEENNAFTDEDETECRSGEEKYETTKRKYD